MGLVEEMINKSTSGQFCPGKWGGEVEKTSQLLQEIIWSPERWHLATHISVIQNHKYCEQSKDCGHNSAHYATIHKEKKPFMDS